jgi:N6-adenosine-specific RNA methylase IME4
MYVMIKNYYRAIYADPPWQYRSRAGGSWSSGSAAKYPTMSLLDICNMGVPAIARSDGCVLFLWTTTPFLVDGSATQVMKSWGFTPKTAIYWRKIMSLGMGFWYRGQLEVCLLGICGDVKAFRSQKPNFIQSKVRAHSQKPEELWQLIEPELDKYNLTPRIELFCRGVPRTGWDGWGTECTNSQDLSL